MKHLKEKLIATIAMLLVATVMLTSASFAWFTISTSPEISDITAEVATNGNLEIALASNDNFQTEPAASTSSDAGKNITWGNLVDLKAYFDTAEIKLQPVSYEAGALKAPKFGLDGRIIELTALTPTWTSLKTGGTGNFEDGGLAVYDNKSAFRIDFFMRTNTAGTISLMDNSTAEANRGAHDTSAEGTYLDTDNPAVKVLFKVDNGDYKVFFDNKTWKEDTVIENAAANTVYKVSMLVFLDGETYTNADLVDGGDLKFNVRFEHSEDLAPFDKTGENYDKP